MHPILASPKRLSLYLLAWLAIAALQVAWISPADWSWRQSYLIILPLTLLDAFICLSPWYTCRRLPLEPAALPRILGAHLAAAVISGLVRVTAAWAAATAFFDSGFPPATIFAIGVFFYLLSAALHYALLAVEQSRHAQKRIAEAAVLSREAELKALRAQVDPHFLFNSLHSINALITADPAGARDMCVRLADFLRNTLRLGERETIPLSEELALTQDYLAVEQVRFGRRLRVELSMDEDCRECLVPPLLLQPLIENAIKHGISGLLEGGEVRLEAHRGTRYLHLTMENAFDPDSPSLRRNGIGLANVRRRLEARYGTDAGLNVSVLENRYRVELTLPAD